MVGCGGCGDVGGGDGFKSLWSFLRLSSRCTFLRFVQRRLPGRLLVEWFGVGMVQIVSLDCRASPNGMTEVDSLSLARKARPLCGEEKSFAASDATNCVVMKVGRRWFILESMSSK